MLQSRSDGALSGAAEPREPEHAAALPKTALFLHSARAYVRPQVSSHFTLRDLLKSVARA